MRSCCGFILVYMLVAGFFISCGNQAREKKFFDVPAYFRAEVETLKTSEWLVSKTVMHNGDTSKNEQKARDINWQKELGIFLESNINKPAYYADMKTDTFTYVPGNHRTTYTSSSGKLPIRKVEIDRGPDGKESIYIRIERSDLISHTSIDAFYIKGQRYFVSGEQKIHVLGDKTTFFAEGHFHP